MSAPNERRALATRLCSAVADGDKKTVVKLLELSTDPSLVNCPSLDGHFPLELAAFWAHVDILKLLLSKGADINAANKRDGSTALHAASMQNHAPIVKQLLVNSKPAADMTVMDNNGRTPVDYASSSDLLWGIFSFAGCQLPRRTKAELQSLQIKPDPPVSRLRGIELGERDISNVAEVVDIDASEADELAAEHGDVLAGMD